MEVQHGIHEYWTGLPFPTPGDLPEPGIELPSPVLAAGFFTTEPLEKPEVDTATYIPVITW